MDFAVISLFPEIFKNYFNFGVVGRALNKNLATVSYYNPRTYTNIVDDKPFGGGSGMVLKPGPIIKSINSAKEALPNAKVVYLTPQGSVFKQKTAIDLVMQKSPLILLSGRYEGIDERIVTSYVDYQYSIGDYILSGGELAALVMMDSIIRLLPGVLGDDYSSVQESFTGDLCNLLEYPQYTRPADFNGQKVPEVLTNGNHKEIARWRRKQSLGRTWLRRPNLLKCINLTIDDKSLLNEFQQEFNTRE